MSASDSGECFVHDIRPAVRVVIHGLDAVEGRAIRGEPRGDAVEVEDVALAGERGVAREDREGASQGSRHPLALGSERLRDRAETGRGGRSAGRERHQRLDSPGRALREDVGNGGDRPPLSDDRGQDREDDEPSHSRGKLHRKHSTKGRRPLNIKANEATVNADRAKCLMPEGLRARCDHDGDVVLPAVSIGGLDEAAAGSLRVLAMVPEDFVDLIVRQHGVETVGAQEEHVA